MGVASVAISSGALLSSHCSIRSLRFEEQISDAPAGRREEDCHE